jgi:hypothetical protein
LDKTQQDLPQQQYDIYKFDYDPNVMSEPSVNDPIQQGRTSNVTAPLTIQWQCNSVTEDVPASPVTMYINVGWQTPLKVMMTKACAAQPPEPDNGGGGWSGAGIFFFSLFILCLVLFVAVFAWNYWREGKRGWDAVPLYNWCAACIDKARGHNRNHTPQMDTSGSRSTYGNFEDSGHAYQSNL